MSYRQGYTELEGQFASVVGNTVVSGLNFAMSGLVVDNAELAVGACSGAAVASGGIAMPHLANASVSGLHLVAQGIGADRILNAAITATQMANASISGLHLVAQGIGADRILNAALTATQMANNAASGLIVSAGFGVLSAGSPAAIGNSAYAGTGATAGGSDAWILYPGVTFRAAPNLVLQNNQAASVTFFVPTGSIAVGSFYVQSSAASSSFTYLAIGSGRSP